MANVGGGLGKVVAAMILAGDIGGTQTTLALFVESSRRSPGFERDGAIVERYASGGFASFDAILGDFFGRHRAPLAAACIGIAGPVRENRCVATNLPWTIDGAELARLVGLDEFRLLNDLEAVGYGIDVLEPAEILELQAGSPAAPRGGGGNRAVIAAGTGLGEAGLFWDGRRWHPFATEGGHADFAPRDELEVALLRFLQRDHERVSWERLLSGPGLVNLYRFLVHSAGSPSAEPPSLIDEMRTGDPAAAIARHAAAGTSALAARALELFVRLYGAEAGNLALKLMATGGLYIGGGIAPKNLPFLQTGEFLEAFLAKGRMRPLLEAMPVRVLLDSRTALLGAARCAAERLRSTGQDA
jgi:glucokinase